MRVKKDIDVHSVKVDKWPMNTATLRLVDFLRSGGKVSPIHVQLAGNCGHFTILDGRHRLLAYKLLGRPTIEARYGIKAKETKLKAEVPTTSHPTTNPTPWAEAWFAR